MELCDQPAAWESGQVSQTSGALQIVSGHDSGSTMLFPDALEINKNNCACLGVIGGRGSQQPVSKEVRGRSAQTRQASTPVQSSEQQGKSLTSSRPSREPTLATGLATKQLFIHLK